MVRHRRTSRRDTVHREVWGVQDRSKRKDATKGKASAKTQGEGGGTLRDLPVSYTHLTLPTICSV